MNIDHKCVGCLVMMFLLFYERRCDYGSLSTYACLTGDTLKGHIQYIMLVISSSQGKFYAKKQIIVFLFSSQLVYHTACFQPQQCSGPLEEFILELIWLVICINEYFWNEQRYLKIPNSIFLLIQTTYLSFKMAQIGKMRFSLVPLSTLLKSLVQ